MKRLFPKWIALYAVKTIAHYKALPVPQDWEWDKRRNANQSVLSNLRFPWRTFWFYLDSQSSFHLCTTQVDLGQPVCQETIRRRLREGGLEHRHPAKKKRNCAKAIETWEWFLPRSTVAKTPPTTTQWFSQTIKRSAQIQVGSYTFGGPGIPGISPSFPIIHVI